MRWLDSLREEALKGLNDPDNHHAVVTHLESDILEFEVKKALGCITYKQS